jgi:eukaryotic-like serine/threonine-protein kinase
MPITDSLVLPSDVTITAVRLLSARLRSRLEAGDDDFAVSRSRGRASARIVAPSGAALLEHFRVPCAVSEVILAVAAREGTDAEGLLAEAFPLLHDCFASGFLVPAGSPEADSIRASLESGDRLGSWTIVRCVRLLADTELYQARARNGQLAAIKLARAPVAPMLRRMLAREAAVLNHLDGSGAPRLLGRGLRAGKPYLVMSWCAGAEPGAAFAAARAESPLALTRLAARVAAAYAALHARGVLHGDVCPGNLLVDRRGRVTLLDFGRARFITPGRGRWDPPRGFVPPLADPALAAALATGFALPPLGCADEQFTVAALIYLLVTRQYHQQFSMDRSTMLAQAAAGGSLPFTARASTPWPALEAVLGRALRPRADERFSSMASFARAMARVGPPPAPTTQLRAASSERLITGFIQDMAQCRPLERLGKSAPVASVTYGMAGVACALYRLALIRGDAAALSAADLWITHALAGRSRRGAFSKRSMDLTAQTVGRISPYHTASGIHVVDGLIAQAMGDRARYATAIRRFAADVAAPCAVADLTLGRAGVLIGAALLLDALPADMSAESAALRTIGNAALDGAWRSAGPLTVSSDPVACGIAHGWGGILYATLRWSRSAGIPVPDAVGPALDRLASLAQFDGRGARWPRPGAGGDLIQNEVHGWCNGPAGMIHLWTAAHRWTGREAHRELAESSGWSAWDAAGAYPDLCCGLAGRAYALLALYRHGGNSEWRNRAEALAARAQRALARLGDLPHPLSLFKGAPGIIVLLADLARPESACMPFFEPEGWPAAEVAG